MPSCPLSGSISVLDMYNKPVADASLVSCPHCDLLQRLTDIPPGASARCPRCNEELWRRREDSLNRTLALTLAAAMLFLIANAVPMLGITVAGRGTATTVLGGVAQLWQDGLVFVAGLVLFTAVVAPALQIGFVFTIVAAARGGHPGRWVGALLRHHPITRTWSMIEVMLLGVLVALVKITDYATVIPGTALFTLGGLVVMLSAIQAIFDPREVWSRIEWAQNIERTDTADRRLAKDSS
jgi:paraquat-inducible protein A